MSQQPIRPRQDWRVVDAGWGRNAVDFAAMGEYVIPKIDKDPVHSTDRYREAWRKAQ